MRMSLKDFHPAVSAWFLQQFSKPTKAQELAWPVIKARKPTLIAAPTGSGKTLAAFLAAIDDLIREGLAQGLSDETHVLYISPLRALSNDIKKNLQQPLQGIRDALFEQGLPDVDIQAWVRTGDTSQAERNRMRRRPPHIIVTTPESLYILLSSDSGRQMLKTVRTVIVDEIHALAGNKRGAHLSLSLERLSTLCISKGKSSSPVRVGLSATQKPIQDMANFLIGTDNRQCTIIDTGHVRDRDLGIEVLDSPLESVLSNEAWEEIYVRLGELIQQHSTTLIFVNNRRLAERAAHHLADILDEKRITAHHGSLAREHRLDAEQRLKDGQLDALVATASLELGIDIGDVDFVCQLGSPRSIATFLQRVGRSGHEIDAMPKGRLFPLSRDDLVECVALLDAVQRDELDRIPIPQQPLDVLAQQIVAEVASREWEELELFNTLRRAWPYKDLSRECFIQVVRMLAEGFSTRRGRRGAYLHRDAVNGRLRAQRSARLVALTNGGAIPDLFDYDVILQPEGNFIGTLNEDFAFESLPGDIFQLGNTSYRMLKIEQGRVFVQDAQGLPPNIPFWFGEAPGRTDELSQAVSRLRESVSNKLEQGVESTCSWLQKSLGLTLAAAQQLTEYLAAAKAALGVLPTQHSLMFERFFDQTGDLHLVIHSPLGSRINRAWGLSLRKCFCRKFNFELQAAATDDNIILSLGPSHSFPLDEVCQYLKSVSVRALLTQALLTAPMFATRWRWNANIALAVPRNRNGKHVPAPFQRNDAQDLLTVIFPDQLACQENIRGDLEIPDHPLVNQTISDCLHEIMDVEGLEKLLNRLEQGEIKITTRELTSPSLMAQGILNARPYAFLDDAPAEERRTLAVQQRRFMDPQAASELGRLDPRAIARVREEAWPDARNADELHDTLVLLGFMTEAEGEQGPLYSQSDISAQDWRPLLTELMQTNRATVLTTSTGKRLWVAAERLMQLLTLLPDSQLSPVIDPVVEKADPSLDKEQALIEVIRGRLEGTGPVTIQQLANVLDLCTQDINKAMLALQQEGFVIRGQFIPNQEQPQWCERRLLARIHRYTLKQLHSEIKPVSAADFMRFLFHWHGLGEDRGEGLQTLAGMIAQLEGFAIPAVAWETEILPARITFYTPQMLDSLCSAGRFIWLRRNVSNYKINHGEKYKAPPVRSTPITLVERQNLQYWRGLNSLPLIAEIKLSSSAHKVLKVLQQHGASFFDELNCETGLLRTQLEHALGELVAWGLVTADSFIGLRALITPSNRRSRFRSRRNRHRTPVIGIEDAGRWTLIKEPATQDHDGGDSWSNIEHIARILLDRYGIVFRKVLERESHIPSWRELLYVYRRLEARGEIRGGRFVSGFSGEQFALPNVLATLRDISKNKKRADQITISAADPLNLTGLITPGQRIPAQASNRILFQNGVPLATTMGGELHVFCELDAQTEWEVRKLLIGKETRLMQTPTRSV